MIQQHYVCGFYFVEYEKRGVHVLLALDMSNGKGQIDYRIENILP